LIYRTIWPTGCVALLLVAMSINASAVPALRITFYAPVQKNSPVRIVGFAYDESRLQFEFLNVSSKPVVAIDIEGLAFAPSGCSFKPPMAYENFGIGRYQVHLLPNERKLTAHDAPHAYLLGFIVGTARDLETAYLKAQIRIFEVDFADGTKWGEEPRFPTGLESKLVASDSEMCSDADAVIATTQALGLIKESRFRVNTEDKKVRRREETEGDTAQVHFSCNLDNQLAACSPSK